VASQAVTAPTTAPQPTAAPATGETINISIAYWGSNEEAATQKLMVEAFEKENPNIKVEQIWVQGSYEEKVQTMIAGGTPPDLIQISNTSLPGFAAAFKPVTLDPNVYTSPLVLDAMTYEGQVYAIPFVVKSKVMGLNVGVFKKNNVPLPSLTEPMSPEEFQELAIKLSSGEGPDRVYGSAPLWFNGWLFQFGNTFYNADGTKVTIGSPEAIAAANFVINSSTKYHYAPTALDAEGQNMWEWFLSGKVAMLPDFGPWNLPLIKQAKEIEWEIVPVPGKGLPLEIDGFGISKDTQQPEAAEALAKFLSQSETAQNILGTSAAAVGVPVIPAAAEAFAKSIPDKNVQAFVWSAANSPLPVGSKLDAQIQSEFSREINTRTPLGTGKESPETVFPELEQRFNELLAQAQ
jgi:multiple sugar transport system substrate-binding protein